MKQYYKINKDWCGKYAEILDCEGDLNILDLSSSGKIADNLPTTTVIGIIKSKKNCRCNCTGWQMDSIRKNKINH